MKRKQESNSDIIIQMLINHPIRTATGILFTGGIVYLGLLAAKFDKSSSLKIGLLAGTGLTFFGELSRARDNDISFLPKQLEVGPTVEIMLPDYLNGEQLLETARHSS